MWHFPRQPTNQVRIPTEFQNFMQIPLNKGTPWYKYNQAGMHPIVLSLPGKRVKHSFEITLGLLNSNRCFLVFNLIRVVNIFIASQRQTALKCSKQHPAIFPISEIIVPQTTRRCFLAESTKNHLWKIVLFLRGIILENHSVLCQCLL